MSDADSQNYIARRVRDLDYDRYFATLFGRGEDRPALLALYAFNLEIATIRETVSEPLIGQMRLQWWRDALDAIHEGRPPNHPVATVLADVVARHRLARAAFERMVDGRETDLAEDSLRDLAALEAYAEATSSSLVELALAIVDASDMAAKELAHHVGIAWCLAGLLRAAPYRVAASLGLLPMDVPAEAGKDRADRVREIVSGVRRHLVAARRLQGQLPRRALAAILPASHIEPYLDRLARAHHDPFDRRLALSRGRRQWLTILSAMRGRI